MAIPRANSQHRYFRAQGAGSKLSLPNASYIRIGESYDARVYLQALDGGMLDLSQVVQLEDPFNGDPAVPRVSRDR